MSTFNVPDLKGKFAFWRYDDSAIGGTLTGRIRFFDARMQVETIEYGTGYFFVPIAVMGEKEGRELMSKIKEANGERNQRIAEANETYRNAIEKLLPALENG